ERAFRRSCDAAESPRRCRAASPACGPANTFIGRGPEVAALAAKGNPAGRLRGSRNKLSEAAICALLRDFSKHGEKAIAKVRRTQPAAYLKILALLVPREHKVEHSNAIKDMTDEQLERSLAFIEEMLAQREAGANAKVIEGEAEVVPSLPAPRSGGTKMPKA